MELAWLGVSRPLVIPWGRAGDVRMQVAFSPDDGMVSITSTEATDGAEIHATQPRPHARCRVRELIGRPPARVDLAGVRARCTRRGDAAALYPELAATGLDYGPAFRQLTRLHIGEGEALAAYRHTTDPADTAQYVAHPALLDGALQACVPLVAARVGAGQAWLPASIGVVRVWRSPSSTGMLHVRDRTRGTAELCFDVVVTDADGSVTAELDAVRLRRVPAPADRAPERPSGTRPCCAPRPISTCRPRRRRSAATTTLPRPSREASTRHRPTRTPCAPRTSVHGSNCSPLMWPQPRSRTYSQQTWSGSRRPAWSGRACSPNMTGWHGLCSA